MGRTIIVGDVHGSLDELEKILTKVAFDKDHDIIVFTGDIMDRGEKSYDAFMFVKALKEELGDRCHYIFGNHEDFLLKSFIDREDAICWTLYNGGADTVHDFKEHGEDVYDYRHWIEENTEVFYETEDFIVCHGGVRDDIHRDSVDDIVWDRTCVKYGRYGGKLLIVGHTPLQCPIYTGLLGGKTKSCRLEYADKGQYKLSDFPTGCIDIDTGCVFGYWLTAMVIEDGKFRLHRVKYHQPAPDADDGIDGEETFE